MRKLILPFILVLFITSCSNKKWSKDYVVKKCNADFSKRDDIKQYFNDAQMKELCDCVGDKMMAKYKSEAEANKDQAGAEQIGGDCARQVLQPATDPQQ